MVLLPIFSLPLPQDGPPEGFGWEGRDVPASSSTMTSDTAIPRRDTFLGQQRCIVCGAGPEMVLQHCHIISESEPDAWHDLRSRNWVPRQSAEQPEHEPGNGLLMCLNHSARFNNYTFFIRFIPDVRKFVLVNYSDTFSLRRFHGKRVALDTNDRYAPLPSLFIVHEMRVRALHPFKLTNIDVARDSWQDWIVRDGVFDDSSDCFVRYKPPGNEIIDTFPLPQIDSNAVDEIGALQVDSK